MATEEKAQGERLLHAVERILAPPTEIRKLVLATQAKEQARLDDLPGPLRERTAHALIAHYALATALGGGAASLPALIPGLGTAATLIGGSLADMTLCLKFEVELIMALASLFGHDIATAQERTYCMLLAGLSTYQELAGKSAALDVALVEGQAVWHYSPRQAGKLLATIFLRLGMVLASRRLVRAVPLVGALVGFAANKVLTTKVGGRALAELHQREQRDGAAQAAGGVAPATAAQVDAEVVDAGVVDAEVVAPEPGEGAA